MKRGDDRAISPVIGAVLLVGILTIGYSIYLVSYVPAQESQAEYQHDQEVRQSMDKLKGAIVDSAQSGNLRSPTLKLGTSYPTQPLAPPRPPITGTLDATTPGEITLANTKAISSETEDFWDGSSRTYSTRLVSYHANYQYQDSPHLRFEHGTIATDYQTDEIVRSRSSIVQGSNIILTTVAADTPQSASQKESVSLTPISPAEETVTVTNTGDPIKLKLRTTLNKTTWKKSLEAELATNGGNIKSLSYTTRSGKPNTVSITLKKGETYDLQVGRVAMGSAGSAPKVAYLSYEKKLPGEVSPGENVTGKVVARDKYNNPVSGAELSADLQGPGKLTLLDKRADSEGVARVKYSAPDSDSNQKAEIKVETASGTVTADLAIDQEIEIEDEDDSDTEFGGGTKLLMENPGSQDGVSCNSDVSKCSVDLGTTSSVDLAYKTDPAKKGVHMDMFTRPGSVVTAPTTETTDGSGFARTQLKAWDTGSTTLTTIAGDAHRKTKFVFEKDAGDNFKPAVTDLSVGAKFYDDDGFGGRTAHRTTFTIDYRIRDSDGFNEIVFKVVPMAPNLRKPACSAQSRWLHSKEGTSTLEVGHFLSANDAANDPGCTATMMKVIVKIRQEDCDSYTCPEETKIFEKTFGTEGKQWYDPVSRTGTEGPGLFPYNWVGDEHNTDEDYQ